MIEVMTLNDFREEITEVRTTERLDCVQHVIQTIMNELLFPLRDIATGVSCRLTTVMAFGFSEGAWCNE